MAVQWTNLPPELIESIGECLDAEIDVLRFRAVCKQWRSLRQPFKNFPCGDVVLPSPTSNAADFTLEERIVYRFELPDNTNPANFWLLKVERLSNGKLRIFNPASHHQIDVLPGTRMPKSLNTLDFRIYEVCKTYALKCATPSARVRRNGEYSLAKKVICKKRVKDGDYCVMLIDCYNKLWFINSGSDKWTLVPSNGMSDIYVDVVNIKGRIFGIDEWGCVWEFNSMLSPRIYAYSGLHPSLERNLVESKDGKFHLVEKVTGENICTSSGGQDRITSYLVSEAVLDTRIWTLNRREWSGADPFNGLIIFAGDDGSFSFPSNGYRVYYTNKCISFQTQEETGPPRRLDLECNCCNTCQNVLRVYGAFVSTGEVKRRFRELQGHNTGVSDFLTGKMGSLLLYHEFADVFWPPPPWLTRP